MYVTQIRHMIINCFHMIVAGKLASRFSLNAGVRSREQKAAEQTVPQDLSDGNSDNDNPS